MSQNNIKTVILNLYASMHVSQPITLYVSMIVFIRVWNKVVHNQWWMLCLLATPTSDDSGSTWRHPQSSGILDFRTSMCTVLELEVQMLGPRRCIRNHLQEVSRQQPFSIFLHIGVNDLGRMSESFIANRRLCVVGELSTIFFPLRCYCEPVCTYPMYSPFAFYSLD